jgi:hypothetical protein
MIVINYVVPMNLSLFYELVCYSIHNILCVQNILKLCEIATHKNHPRTKMGAHGCTTTRKRTKTDSFNVPNVDHS